MQQNASNVGGLSCGVGVWSQVVGVHDDASEVLFDQPFAGGSDLHGRCALHTRMLLRVCLVQHLHAGQRAVGLRAWARTAGACSAYRCQGLLPVGHAAGACSAWR